MWKKMRLPLLIGSAVGLVMTATVATAQNYYDRADGYYQPNPPPSAGYYGPPEEVIIRAPRHRQERGELGGPIQDVAMSDQVRFDDLDLRTSWGVHELKNRIRATANILCRQLDSQYPITASDSPPCYKAAVADAMDQADIAIRQANVEYP